MASEPDQIVLRIFTSVNPETGSAPPTSMAWAVFANGTAFFTTPTDALPSSSSLAAIEEAAKAALRALGPVQAGTPSADFNPVRLAGWYPDEPVWIVFFGDASRATIATVVVVDAKQPVAAGLLARSRRELDYNEMSVLVVRGFDGTLEKRAS